ncbi:MAG: MBL fold metallo-hydrolase [Deltaproteobacteria bacterium]|nr:MAG: MBL fold metallo-hydrolase [Deltaproteobacteria bacterium]
MKIKCWGSRGSIPVSGREYLKYGGDTTCMEIQSQNGVTIIVDAGSGIRRLGNQLLESQSQAYHILFTHAHLDHIIGFPFFKPLHCLKRKINMYHSPFHERFVDRMFSDIMTPPYFPIPCSGSKANLVFIEPGPAPFDIDSVHIEPIPLSHPNGGSGYKFTEDGKTFVFLTDNELGYIHPGGKSSDAYRIFCEGADLLIHDAEYTPAEYGSFGGWGHSTYMDALQLAMDADVSRVGFFHTNQERTDREVDDMVGQARQWIGAQNRSTKCLAVAADMEFEL